MSTDLFRKVAIILEEEVGSEGEEGEREAFFSPPHSRTWANGREGEAKRGEERGSSDHESDEDVDDDDDDVGVANARPTTSSPPLPALTSKRTTFDAEDDDNDGIDGNVDSFRARSDPR